MKKLAIVGANGFVGSYLQEHFRAQNIEVLPLDRKEMAKSTEEIAQTLEGVQAVINLAGAPIIKRWSEEYKKVLYNSRIDTTNKLVEAMGLMQTPPHVFISTSAVGIYGRDGEMSEHSFTYADNFLATICKDWESAALKAERYTRVAIFRFGVILGDGGALAKMLLPFKLGLGGVIGDGSEYFSWIHINDLARAYDFVIKEESQKGVFNLTAPIPVTNRVYTKALGSVLSRPTIFPVPKFALHLIFSEGAMVLTEGQQVVPKKLEDAGFVFEYPEVEGALKNILKSD